MKRRITNNEELVILLQMLKRLNSIQKKELIKYMRQLPEHNTKDGRSDKLTGR